MGMHPFGQFDKSERIWENEENVLFDSYLEVDL